MCWRVPGIVDAAVTQCSAVQLGASVTAVLRTVNEFSDTSLNEAMFTAIFVTGACRVQKAQCLGTLCLVRLLIT
jgi:hypothetical protein